MNTISDWTILQKLYLAFGILMIEIVVIVIAVALRGS